MFCLRMALIGVVLNAGVVWAEEPPPAPAAMTTPTATERTVAGENGGPEDAMGRTTTVCEGLACSERVRLRLGKGGDLMLTAFLSLQPMPIDFGNFYAGNWRTAIVLSGLEVSLMTAGAVVLMSNATSMGRGTDATFRDEWTIADRNVLLGLAGGYIATKLTAAWIAVGTVAKRYDQPRVSLLPTVTRGGGGVQLALRLP